MDLKKLRKYAWTVGLILLIVGLFAQMCMWDVVRLHPSLENVPGNVANHARENTAKISVDAVIDPATLPETIEAAAPVDAPVIPEGAPHVVDDNGDERVLLTYEQFVAAGGKLKTDKFGAPTFMKIAEADYAYGTISGTQIIWDGMTGFQRVVTTMAPANVVLIVLGAALIVLSLWAGFTAAKRASDNPEEFLKQSIRSGTKKFGRLLADNIIILMILLLAAVVSILRPNFLSESNIRNLLSNTAVRFIIAMGVSGCLITKGTDLSAGRVAGLSACLCGILLQRADYSAKFLPGVGELPIIAVLAIVAGICGLIGLGNGAVVAYLKVPPFIATLGMQTLVYGACLVYTGATPIGGLRSDYTGIATGYVGNRIFSYIAIIAVVVALLMWFLYNKTRHGKYMYAIGGNENAAEVAGINTRTTKLRIYMLAAMLYGLTGFLIAAKSGGASVNTAQGYELEAIAGCTIGGVSVNGGVGRITGILVGVLVFEVLKIALQFLGVPSDYTYIAQGLVIIIAVALDLRKYLAKK